jgi:hypothetical protein
LRRFLGEVPKRPRPTVVDRQLLAAWTLSGSENYTIIRVLKAVNLLNERNEPTDTYAAFMRAGRGPAVLGQQIRQVYAPLFEAAHAPHREQADELRNLFNIHASGSAAGTIDLQIQTFKALCDFAAFDGAAAAATEPGGAALAQSAAGAAGMRESQVGPPIHIDLHIHLPPGKTSRDYQYIIQDIARYLYGTSGAVDERKED